MQSGNNNKQVLVFSHIEKSAGTSLRALLWKNYGRQRVFWYGFDLPFGERLVPEHLSGYAAVGGHFDLSRFDSVQYPTLQTAIVRDPVVRAASLFHYNATQSHAARRTRLMHWGFDPSSMATTIKWCIPFRRAIQNTQCRRLCGKRRFRDAKRKLATSNSLIGHFEGLPKFAEALGARLGWTHVAMPNINRGLPDYLAELLSNQRLVNSLERLNRQDRQLYEYVKERGILENLSPKESLSHPEFP